MFVTFPLNTVPQAKYVGSLRQQTISRKTATSDRRLRHVTGTRRNSVSSHSRRRSLSQCN